MNRISSSNDRVAPERLPHRERVRRISGVIRLAERRLHERFPVLRHQNALGLAIFLGSSTGIVTCATLFALGLLPAWSCVLLSAVFVSFLHELEHDLIHNLYFKNRPALQHFMMYGVWFFRPNFPSPWYRRKVHLWHHKASGQTSDMEERYLGNGMRYTWRRMLSMIDTFSSVALRFRELHHMPGADRRRAQGAQVWTMGLYYLIWFTFLGTGLVRLMLWAAGVTLPGWTAYFFTPLDFLAVTWILPCTLTRASIGIVSSSLHYYGDVKTLLEQTQVLTPWYFAPFQLFCFNFGGTHAIHHIVVNQPFYMRQLVAPWAHRAMKKYGVRFNDTDTYRRANRYDLRHAA